MGDRFGLVTEPVARVSDGEAAGDPALSRLGAYLQAYMNANGSAAFSQVMPSAPLVRAVFGHNPEDVVFSERDLPALFLWREEADAEYVAEDYLLETSDVSLLWVFPPAPQANQRLRQSFVNATWKLANLAIEAGRTPGFVVVGDMDPRAKTEGSLIYPYLGVWSIILRRRRRRTFVETMADSPSRRYAALEMNIELREQHEYDLGVFAPMSATNQTTARDRTGKVAVAVRY
ncbi:hypothetical protein LZC95_08025 [Pendulispora brunnea]|uniref:Uncharacterized protein n=1 Tax=Pendulispora brunnea TaxID=2905690 RepID=A0ABZ2KDK7_9BACT